MFHFSTSSNTDTIQQQQQQETARRIIDEEVSYLLLATRFIIRNTSMYSLSSFINSTFSVK